VDELAVLGVLAPDPVLDPVLGVLAGVLLDESLDPDAVVDVDAPRLSFL
jgi:hypothetical protein